MPSSSKRGRGASSAATTPEPAYGQRSSRRSLVLRKKLRKSGEVCLFCYRQRRLEDGKWVEATPIRVGSLKEFPSEWKSSGSIPIEQRSVSVRRRHLVSLRRTQCSTNSQRTRTMPRSRKRIRRSSSIGAISNVGPCPAGRERQHSPSSPSKSSVGSRRSGRSVGILKAIDDATR